MNRWPDVRWVLAGGRYREVQEIGRRLWRDARVWFDIARVQGPMDCLRSLRDAVGVHRLLFGTNLPFIVPQSPIMELGDARLPETEDADVRYRNARRRWASGEAGCPHLRLGEKRRSHGSEGRDRLLGD